MKYSTLVIIFTLSFLAANLSQADATSDYRDALRIVVITDDEGIHYASGCAFYELRDLISEGAVSSTYTMAKADDPLYEIRVLGKAGEKSVYVGDHWIGNSEGATSLSSATYERIVELVERRKGQGVTQARIDASIRRALEHIQDPAFVEEHRCTTR